MGAGSIIRLLVDKHLGCSLRSLGAVIGDRRDCADGNRHLDKDDRLIGTGVGHLWILLRLLVRNLVLYLRIVISGIVRLRKLNLNIADSERIGRRLGIGQVSECAAYHQRSCECAG